MTAMAEKKKKKGADVQRWSLRVFFGEIVSSSFFSHNKFTILIVVVLLMFYIAIKYECQTRMETIKKLETELAIVKSEGIRQQSRYMSRTRESMMQQLVDSMRLNLKIQDQPPYRLTYDEE